MALHTPHEHHITPIPVLMKTFGMLTVLMALTILAARLPLDVPAFAPFQHYWFLMNFIALAIAVTKASYVVMVFMGVKYTTNLVRIYAFGGFIWFFLLFFMFGDYTSRPWEPVPGWEAVPESGLPRDRAEVVPQPAEHLPAQGATAPEGAGHGGGH
ncbi:MAG: hypothetical protein KIT11_08580 [Fimbriimonadaceae bacterium]|nr:hypothetical protein [Fimbriimonadaceae bacterium]QYK56408.1 MAG: hypothetical protein KF733_02775 [Fimbriimonadaceae bacterium]